MCQFELFGGKLHLSLRNEDRVHYDLGRIGLDRGRGALRTEYVCEVASDLQRRDGGIVRSPCELERATNHCHSTIIALL